MTRQFVILGDELQFVHILGFCSSRLVGSMLRYGCGSSALSVRCAINPASRAMPPSLDVSQSCRRPGPNSSWRSAVLSEKNALAGIVKSTSPACTGRVRYAPIPSPQPEARISSGTNCAPCASSHAKSGWLAAARMLGSIMSPSLSQNGYGSQIAAIEKSTSSPLHNS